VDKGLTMDKGLTLAELEKEGRAELLPDRVEMRRHRRRHRSGCQLIDVVKPDGTTAHVQNC